mmetsp:Transcript_8825/g.19057  ORF Transcript_8825/g.19057 Transcript_8825/m.19057 type:complete len:284 (+) Transcript_8825:153-1004(+)
MCSRLDLAALPLIQHRMKQGFHPRQGPAQQGVVPQKSGEFFRLRGVGDIFNNRTMDPRMVVLRRDPLLGPGRRALRPEGEVHEVHHRSSRVGQRLLQRQRHQVEVSHLLPLRVVGLGPDHGADAPERDQVGRHQRDGVQAVCGREPQPVGGRERPQVLLVRGSFQAGSGLVNATALRQYVVEVLVGHDPVLRQDRRVEIGDRHGQVSRGGTAGVPEHCCLCAAFVILVVCDGHGERVSNEMNQLHSPLSLLCVLMIHEQATQFLHVAVKFGRFQYGDRVGLQI